MGISASPCVLDSRTMFPRWDLDEPNDKTSTENRTANTYPIDAFGNEVYETVQDGSQAGQGDHTEPDQVPPAEEPNGVDQNSDNHLIRTREWNQPAQTLNSL